MTKTARRANGTIKSAKTVRVKSSQFTPPAPAGTVLTLTRQEDGKKVAKFGTGEWQAGQINTTVYVPLELADGITSVRVVIER